MIKIDKKDLLLVIDMQNVYRPGEEWACESFQQSLDNLTTLLDQFPKENVAFTKFVADDDATGVWAEYNQVNSAVNESEYLNDVASDLKPYITEANMFVKSTYSSMKNPQLNTFISKYERVFVTGVVAECCVLSTVFELIDLGKKIFYVEDCVSGENKEKENAVKTALEGLSPLHVEFIKASNI